ncbi:putative C6 transcription factor [Xylogone sp. PMI_703]|nr:putative C6 transcription factor [Xylogone sp. PMI_703]
MPEHEGPSNPNTAPEPTRSVRKRRRPTLACYECRRRKVRCDRNSPCAQCKQHGLTVCTYYGDHESIDGLDVFALQNRRPRVKLKSSSATTLNKNVDHSTNQDESSATFSNPTVPKENTTPHAQMAAASEASPGIMQVFKTTSSTTSSPQTNSSFGPLHGFKSKTRVFGAGHWMNAYTSDDLEPFSALTAAIEPASGRVNPGISEAVAKCKELARDIKAQRPGRGPLPVHILRSIPSRDITEQLIPVYFDTFESCYRILHLQSFYRDYVDYLDHPETATSTFLLKLLLVISNVACLHEDTTVRDNLRKKARTWIHAAEVWLSAPLEKQRFTIDGLQVYCLLLLARQVNRVGADLIWISTGSLMRMGVQMGLHQDPIHFEEMTPLERELRRRLWFTIMEINIQSALDSGMSAMIEFADHDTQAPSNFNDDDLESSTQTDLSEREASKFTQTSFQRILAASLPLRLEAIKIINDLRTEPTYDEVLHLGSRLAAVCRDAAAMMGTYRSAAKDVRQFEFHQISVDHFLRRFLLCLHRPYAIRAIRNPLYSYSLKISLETAHIIISLGSNDTYRRLMLTGGAMFQDIITNSAPIVFVELISQLEEDVSEFMKEKNRARRQPLIDDVRNALKMAEDRVRHGETNVKGYVFLSMAMGQVEAMQNGTSVMEGISRAANESLALCYSLLKSMAAKNDSENTEYSEQENTGYEKAVSEPYTVDLDFDFLDDGTLDLDAPGSWLVDGLEERSWL